MAARVTSADRRAETRSDARLTLTSRHCPRHSENEMGLAEAAQHWHTRAVVVAPWLPPRARDEWVLLDTALAAAGVEATGEGRVHPSEAQMLAKMVRTLAGGAVLPGRSPRGGGFNLPDPRRRPASPDRPPHPAAPAAALLPFLHHLPAPHDALAPPDLPPRALRLLQIGFNAGHSAATLLSAGGPTAKLVSFDLGEHPCTTAADAYLASSFPNKHTLVLGDSRSTLADWRGTEACAALSPFDLCFIDGGHSYEVASRSVCREAP